MHYKQTGTAKDYDRKAVDKPLYEIGKSSFVYQGSITRAGCKDCPKTHLSTYYKPAEGQRTAVRHNAAR